MGMLWERGPLFVREMIELFPEPHPHPNTISTFVRILEDKGYVAHEKKGGSYRYYAVAKAEDFAGRSLAQVIQNFFAGSPLAAVSALVKEEKLSADDLRQLLDMVEKNS